MNQLPEQNQKAHLVLHFDIFEVPVFRNFFLRYGIDMFPLSNVNASDNFYNFYISNFSRLYEVYKMLEDEESKKVFISYIKGRVTERLKDFRFAPEPQYFLQNCFPKQGDIAIDGGAYDGATARDFAMQGAKVYSFEMSEENYPKCLKLAERYNFVVENLGLSDRKFESFYNESGAGSSRQDFDTGKIAKFIDLDSYVIKENLPRVDYIKLDIEGSELQMLHGACKTISRWKPKMAISAYHRRDDLWTLAEYIKSIRSDYKFFFRHYKTNLADYDYKDDKDKQEFLYGLGSDCLQITFCEAVLYCI